MNGKNWGRRIKSGAEIILIAVMIFAVSAAGERKLSSAEWTRLRKGEIIREVKNEGGTQSGAWSAGLFNHPPPLMWKVITSLELYSKFIKRTTVSVLLDEQAKNKVLASKTTDANSIEKLFKGMKPGFKRIEPDGRWTVYSYQRNQLPWPVNDRWVLLEITHDDKAMKQSWKRLAGTIKQDFGSWKLSLVDKDKTLAICQIHLDLDIPATGPFVAYAMDVSLPETYRAFENMAQAYLKGKIK